MEGVRITRVGIKLSLGFFHYLINIEHENAKRMHEIYKKKKKHRRNQQLRFISLPKLP